MNKLTLIIGTILLVSCENKRKETTPAQEYSPEIQAKARAMADSLIENSLKNAYFDTTGLYNSPVKVVSARLVKKEYSSYKDISLTYKNVSNKKIDGIKFRWYGLTAFGDAADMGNYSGAKGFGSGFDDDQLRPGRTVTNGWGILSSNAKKIVLAWPYEIVFEDGTKWKCGK